MSIQTNVGLNPTRTSAIRWGAVSAGLLIAVVSGMLLNLLGLGLGFVTVPVAGASLSSLGNAAVVWYIVSGAVAMYLGGWASGFFSHTFQRTEGVLYGIVTWALATLLGVVFTLFGAGSVIGGASSFVTGSLSSAHKKSTSIVAKSTKMVIPNLSEVVDTINEQVNALVDNVANSTKLSVADNGPSKNTGSKKVLNAVLSNNTRFEMTQAIHKLLSADQDQVVEQARQKVLDLMTKNTDLTREDAEKVIKDWQDYYANMKQYIQEKTEAAKQQAKEAAVKSSQVVGSVAIGVFFTLLLGALAASYGSLLGARAQAKDLDVRKCCSSNQ